MLAKTASDKAKWNEQPRKMLKLFKAGGRVVFYASLLCFVLFLSLLQATRSPKCRLSRDVRLDCEGKQKNVLFIAGHKRSKLYRFVYTNRNKKKMRGRI